MAEGKQRRYTLQERENALFRAALCVMIERNGGSIEYTEVEYQAIKARLGEYVIKGEVDRSSADPVVRITLIPDAAKGSMPVS